LKAKSPKQPKLLKVSWAVEAIARMRSHELLLAITTAVLLHRTKLLLKALNQSAKESRKPKTKLFLSLLLTLDFSKELFLIYQNVNASKSISKQSAA